MSSFKSGAVVCDPIVHADYLQTNEARKWLADRGLPSRKLRKKSKATVISRILKLDSSYVQHVIADALNNRSASVNASAAGPFTRLSTQLILLVAELLSIQSMVAAAMTCKFLRHRLSLSLNGPPSPGLAALRSLQLWQRGKPIVKPQAETLKAIFSRTLKLRSLCLDHIHAVPLPTLLRHLRIRSHTPLPLDLLHNCQHLQTLHLSGCEPERTLGRTMLWPQLLSFSLHVKELHRQEFVPFMLSSAPNLEELAIYCNYINFALPAHPALKRFKLQYALIQNTAMLANVNIQELDLLQCPHRGLPMLLPKTLVRLSCDALSLLGTFGNNNFTALRKLRLWTGGKHREPLLDVFKHSCLPALEEFAIEFTFPRQYDAAALSLLVFTPLSNLLRPTQTFPKLAKLDLLFMQSLTAGLPPGDAYHENGLGFEQWTPASHVVAHWHAACELLQLSCAHSRMLTSADMQLQNAGRIKQFELSLSYMTVVDSGQRQTAVRERVFPQPFPKRALIIDVIDLTKP